VRILITALLIAVAFISATFAQEGDSGTVEPSLIGVDIFPLEDLRAGMKAKAYTVIRGTDIEEFNVEVLELIPDGGFDGGPMILARFSGEIVDHSDGIAGGYSGSPVYIGKKLVGAVSMAMPMTDTHIGGITPIQRMMKSLPRTEQPDFSGVTVLPETDNNGIDLSEETTAVSFVDDHATALAYNDRMRAAGENSYAAVAAKTPFYFSGISPSVMSDYGPALREMLGERIEVMEVPMGKARDQGLLLLEPGDAPGLFQYEKTEIPPLLPGDACVATLAEGDVELYGIGTVTYTDTDNRFLIFGHSMFGEGQTFMPIGKGYITWVYGSIIRGFKAGVRLNTVGVITQDHSAACGGSFDLEPDMIPVRLKLKEMDYGNSVPKRFKVVRHKDYTPMLVSLGLNQAATEVLDRRPSGTLKLSYHIEGVGLKEPLRRTNYYYDDLVVFSSGTYEILPLADLLANNIYRDVKSTKVDILAEITSNRINASIDDAEFIEDEEDEGVVLHFNDYVIEEDSEAVDENNGGDGEEGESEPAVEPTAPADAAFDFGTRRFARLYEAQQAPPVEEEMVPVDPYMEMAPTDDIPTYQPGDTIRIKVCLQPYREDPVWREFSIQVPDDYVSGSTSLYIHGGGDLISFSELGGKGRMLFGMGPIIELEDRDLDSILDQIVTAPLNNELVLTLARPYDYNAEMEGANGNGDDDEEEPEPTTDAVYQMEWVIYNSWMLPVNILTEEDAAEMEEMEAEAEASLDDTDDSEPVEDDSDNSEYETQLPF